MKWRRIQIGCERRDEPRERLEMQTDAEGGSAEEKKLQAVINLNPRIHGPGFLDL